MACGACCHARIMHPILKASTFISIYFGGVRAGGQLGFKELPCDSFDPYFFPVAPRANPFLGRFSRVINVATMLNASATCRTSCGAGG